MKILILIDVQGYIEALDAQLSYLINPGSVGPPYDGGPRAT